ncbi:MAG: cell wall hydrolase [Sphingosinicella sp.]|nr:cell wall hydrolase [Sphingosinicella sp.]
MRFRKPAREHLLGSIMLAVAALLYLIAGISVTSIAGPDGMANAKVAHLSAQKIAKAALPAAEPLQFKQVEPNDAVAFNASIPVFEGPNPSARPFILSGASSIDQQRSLECLTAAVYYEAATEPAEGQRAVAQVVLNRVRHPAYPNSVCGVVFQGSERATGCQFTFTCDGSIARAPHAGFWARARAVAQAALSGSVYAPVGWSTHYHTNWVVPYWSSSLVKAANVGTHIFYRWEGGWGRGPAFTSRYTGTEPVLAKMRYIGVGGPVDELLTPEQQAALAAAPLAGEVIAGQPAEGIAAAGNYDPAALNRAIIRRFEPVKRSDVAAVVTKQTKPGEKVDDSYRWGMTGGVTGEGFGKKAEAPAATPAS